MVINCFRNHSGFYHHSCLLFLADTVKRQSVTSAGSGSVSELRLEEKRLSDAHSLTESRDYTFEESEDDIGTQGTHVDISKDRTETKPENDKTKPGLS